MENLIELLELYKTKILAIHILGTAIGLGGATISDILFLKFLKDYRISKKENEVLHVLKTVVLSSLFFIILSGIGLYLPNQVELNQSAAFLVKVIAVGVVTVNGIALHVFVAPYLIHLNLKEHHKMGRNWHRLSFALGGISAASWYSVFFIATLKTLFTWSFSQLLTLYITIVITAIISSQILENILSKRALKNK